jgi:DNA repair protein RecO (recombination protein O)
MLIKAKSIVLHYIKHTDSSLIAYFYTDIQGRLPVIIQGISGKKSGNKRAFLQPLTLVDTEIYFSTRRNIQRLKEISIFEYYQNIPFNPLKNIQALFIAELLYKTLKEEESNPELFSFLYDALYFFDRLNSGNQYFYIKFLIDYTKYLGFFPDCNHSQLTPYFNLLEGHFQAWEKENSYLIDSGLSALIQKLATTKMTNIAEFNISMDKMILLAHKFFQYYNIHGFKIDEIKSKELLKNLFGFYI